MGKLLLLSNIIEKQRNGAGKDNCLQYGNGAGHLPDAEHKRQHGEQGGDKVEDGHGKSFLNLIDAIGIIFISFAGIAFLT